MKKILFILIPLFIFLNSFGLKAMATENDEIFFLSHEGRNNYFDFYITAGEEGTLNFTIRNTSLERKTNHILIYDSMTAVNGGNVVMTPENYTVSDTAGWFDKNHIEITLDSGESRNCSISYIVPEDVKDGFYTVILALYAYSKDTAMESEEVTLRIDSNYSSTLAVVLRKGEEAYADFRLLDGIQFIFDDSGGQSYLMIPIENIGNAYGFPVVEYSIKNNMGIELQKDSMCIDIFYRKTDSYAAVPVDDGILSTGIYTIDVTAISSKNRQVFDKTSYSLEMDNKTIKEVIKSNIESGSDGDRDTEWKNDFIVMGKKELVIGSTGLLGVAALSVFLIILLKGKNRN